ncbi:VanZ family protein [Sutcliffiella halmapala]|uniref:VanZ family protein n=1 Tax=Sutcliffiella halmapala TaxID=79882 RepID=UPI000994BB61|nr:VanZ family protein [Sutcliffiella halmapala]
MKKFIVPTIISLFVFLLLTPLFQALTSYLHPIVLLVLFGCIFVCTLLIYLYIRNDHLTLSANLLSIFMILYAVSLLILLFFRPNEQQYDTINLIPFSTISLFLSGEVNWLVSFYNLAANIGLFIPFGVLLKWRTKSRTSLLLVPIFAISAIELLQYITSRGSLDIDDLLLNTLGFWIGYALTPVFKKIIIVKR